VDAKVKPVKQTSSGTARFINRELSWLEFNQRVLDEALDPEIPLLERVKFFCIVSSNLDEFFEVRVAGLKQQIESDVVERSLDGLTASEAFVKRNQKRTLQENYDAQHGMIEMYKRHNVPVDRRFLEIRYHAPERWTIVQCEPRVMEKLGRIFPLTYAVCPTCRHRQGFETRSNDMTCDKCHKAAGMAWDELS
jgi:hypothetical protein